MQAAGGGPPKGRAGLGCTSKGCMVWQCRLQEGGPQRGTQMWGAQAKHARAAVQGCERRNARGRADVGCTSEACKGASARLREAERQGARRCGVHKPRMQGRQCKAARGGTPGGAQMWGAQAKHATAAVQACRRGDARGRAGVGCTSEACKGASAGLQEGGPQRGAQVWGARAKHAVLQEGTPRARLVPVGDDGGLLYERLGAAQAGRDVGQPHAVHELGRAPQVRAHLHTRANVHFTSPSHL